MNSHADGAIIAERVFETSGRGQLIVRIHRPVEDPQGDWSCGLEVDRNGVITQSRVFGVDSAQALLLAFDKARIQLETDPERSSITWLGMSELGLTTLKAPD